ncbi:MAG TPA: pilin [Patescibacteria group bacterium]|nr:pilin [Patescibacteria group bacterium]
MFKKIVIFSVFISFLLYPAVELLAQENVDPTAKNEQNTSASQEIGKQLNAAGGATGAGYGNPQDPRIIVAMIIRSALQLLGIIFVVLIIYAGYLWMTAGGNDQQVEKSKGLLKNSIIGLIILLSAYSITWFAFRIAQGNYTDYSSGIFYEPQPDPFCEDLGCY